MACHAPAEYSDDLTAENFSTVQAEVEQQGASEPADAQPDAIAGPDCLLESLRALSIGPEPSSTGPLHAARHSSPIPDARPLDDEPGASSLLGPSAVHPFATEPGDHAETPPEAYQHLEPLLSRLARRLNKSKAELRIYDPFFCEGSMVQHMDGLGFESVYNRNEDFYAMQQAGAGPDFDVLITNPPFSGDHIERIFEFAVASHRPWMLLIPQYVARKAFFLEWLTERRAKSGACRPVFLAPKQQPYVFAAPASRPDVRTMRLEGGEAGSSSDRGTGVELAGDAAAADAATAAAGAGGGAGASNAFEVAAGSFQCVWLVSLGTAHQQPVLEWWRKNVEAGAACAVAASVAELPQLTAAPKLTPAERRWKKKLAMQQETGAEGGEAAVTAATAASGGRSRCPGVEGGAARNSGAGRHRSTAQGGGRGRGAVPAGGRQPLGQGGR